MPTEPLVCDIAISSSGLNVTMSGCLDLYTVAETRRRLDNALVGQEGWVAVDVQCVMFIDSAGLALLIWLAKRLAGRPKPKITARVGSQPARILDLSRLEVILDIVYVG